MKPSDEGATSGMHTLQNSTYLAPPPPLAFLINISIDASRSFSRCLLVEKFKFASLMAINVRVQVMHLRGVMVKPYRRVLMAPLQLIILSLI